jgi:NAD(P)-dependent dehydrogenase (short-subunit alcohol dehydrogenase family)
VSGERKASLSVLITGSSTGIGRATALRLDRGGHQVFAAVRNERDAQALTAELSPRSRAVRLDVTSATDVARVVSEVGAGAAGLDGLVNNAGVAFGGPLECVPVSELREQFEVNVIGLHAVTAALLPALRRARGRVVNVGSMSGKVTTPLMGAYCASKHAVESLSDALRQELAPSGVAVALIEPGAIKTEIWAKGDQLVDRVEGRLDAEQREIYGRWLGVIRQLLKRQEAMGAPAEAVAEAIEHALTASRPRTRYPVGKDAWLGAAARWALPDRALDRLLARVMTP